MRAAAAAFFVCFIIVAAFAFFFAIVAAFAFAASTAAATAALVDVTVSDLFFSRSAHILHGDVEVKVLTRQRVITIHGDIVFLDFNNANRDWALFRASLKLHADFERFNTLKAVAGDDLFERGIGSAIAIFGRDAHFNRLASALTDESGFEAGNDVTVPM